MVKLKWAYKPLRMKNPPRPGRFSVNVLPLHIANMHLAKKEEKKKPTAYAESSGILEMPARTK